MSRPSVSQPPTVSWPDPSEADAMPNAWAVIVAVQQLVNEVWHRLPEPVREIIAFDLEEVHLMGGDTTAVIIYTDDECIMQIRVGDRQCWPQWKQTMIWELASNFGYVFLRSIARCMARAERGGTRSSTADPSLPAAAWYRALTCQLHQPERYQDMTEQAAVALAVGWGFGKERAAVEDVN